MVNPSPGFWAGKSVLLTGHTGFKGAWLALWLEMLGARVHGYALAADTSPNLYFLAGAVGLANDTIGDLRDPFAVRRAVAAARPEIVFHLGAQALVRKSYAQPLETLATNVMGTAHLLDALRETGTAKAVVVVTTDKCYENREWVWPYRETDALGGHDLYSASKACAEIVAAAYRSSFLAAGATAVATARAGNVIGGGDWAEDRLIPDCIRAFNAQTTLRVRNPHAVRPWQHVLEPLSGYLLLAERLCAGEARFASSFNFGPRAQGLKPVSWLVAEAARIWGPGAAWEQDHDAHPHEAQMLALDASKARAILPWRPRLTLEQCLQWTIEWYRDAAHTDAARSAVQRQIERYVSIESEADD